MRIINTLIFLLGLKVTLNQNWNICLAPRIGWKVLSSFSKNWPNIRIILKFLLDRFSAPTHVIITSVLTTSFINIPISSPEETCAISPWRSTCQRRPGKGSFPWKSQRLPPLQQSAWSKKGQPPASIYVIKRSAWSMQKSTYL